MKFSYKTVDLSILTFALAIAILTASSGFALFLDGGARVQGADNAVVRTGLFKYIEVAAVPISVLVPLYFLVLRGRYAYLRNLASTTGFRVATVVVLFSTLQRLNGSEFSHAMLASLLNFLAIIVICLLAASLATRQQLLSALNLIYAGCFGLSLVLVFFVPSYGISINAEETWQGMFTHKNNLGIFCASYVALLLPSWRVSRPITALNMCLAIPLVLFSKSYTAVAVFALGILLALLPTFIKNWIIILRRPLVIITLAAMALLVSSSITGVSSALLDKDTSFSGRSLIWGFSLAGYLEHPILGQGMGSLMHQVSRNAAGFYNATGQILSSHHNGFIGALYDFGAAGASLLLLIIYTATRRCGYPDPLCYALVSCVTLGIVMNTFEERLFSPNIIFLTLMLLIAMTELTRTNGGRLRGGPERGERP